MTQNTDLTTATHQNHPATLGALRESGYRSKTVKAELRANLMARLTSEGPIFPGIQGYDDTVIPEIENAILSEQDIIFLGERGQGKTRLARTLITLLDPEVPVVQGCEIHDDPFAPICHSCRDTIDEMGDETPVTWLPRDLRYGEKLATPDTTIADLLGEVDPIRVAEGRYLADERTIHFGLIPRSHRGIFCINELPDLAERIQVGLLNILEERDVQIRGYKVRMPLDLLVVASANPEDYTNRGRIITPLKDRCGSQIRTHYPRTVDLEISIMEQERARLEIGDRTLSVPSFMREIIAEISQQARKNPDINQHSGVSVRVSIANYENLLSNALKRAIRLREPIVAPRISDLRAIHASTIGKIELDTIGEADPDTILRKLIQSAVKSVFSSHFLIQELEEVILGFEAGDSIEASDTTPSSTYAVALERHPGLRHAVSKLLAGQQSPESTASAIEFLLEGLHLNRKLNKDRRTGAYRR
jgi:magnesium chelatase subunit I